MRALLTFTYERNPVFDSPLLDYPEIVWGDKSNDTLLEDPQLLQNRAAKIILDKPKYNSAMETLSLLDL